MNKEEIIKNNLLNISIKAMKDNFLSLDDKIKQKEFCKLLDENQQLKEDSQVLRQINMKLGDNWNELEQWLYKIRKYNGSANYPLDVFTDEILNKMQEIKGGDLDEIM